jgi:hypothetical protein
MVNLMTKPGLQSSLPALARVLGEKPMTLYDRQKLLVAEGLLHPVPGRGPGSGVRATPESIAMLLVGMMSGPGLAGSGPITREIAEAITRPPWAPPKPCALTGAERFIDALTCILSDEARAARVKEIRVRIGDRLATIEFDGGPSTIFVDPDRSNPLPAINTITVIYDRTIRALAAAVHDMTASNKGE